MKAKVLKLLCHAAIVIVSVVVLVLFPVVRYFDIFHASDADAVSSASIKLPDQPSGTFYVFINSSLHEDSIDDWKSFFCEENMDVIIFDDIRCMATEEDVSGIQLADRYKAALPENQMSIRTENPTMLVSKIESGYIDMAILSSEMANAMDLSVEANLPGIEVFVVQSEGGE